MAVYYFRNNTASWNTAANWSLTNGGGATGAIPTAADDVIFTNLSGACTVDTASAVCKTITFTTYTNTITMTNSITVSGNVTLGASMGISGTGLLRPNATGTLTSNGKVWSSGMDLRGISTFTLADNWVITGSLLIGLSTETIVINGAFSFSVGGNLTIGTSTTVSGAATIILNGTGTVTTTGQLRNNLTINTAGTITFSGTISYNTGTLTYTAGTVTTTGSTLSIAGSTTLNTAGITWNNISISVITLTSSNNLSCANFSVVAPGAGGTATLTFTTGTLSVTGTFTVTQNGNGIVVNLSSNITVGNFISNAGTAGGNTFVNNNTITISGSLTVSRPTFGTTNLIMNGTGTWSGNNGLYLNLTFNSPSGTITVSGPVSFGTPDASSSRSLVYTAGTIVTTGSTLTMSHNGAVLSINTGSVIWENFNFPEWNQASATATITLLSDLNIRGLLYIYRTGLNGAGCAFSGAFNVYVASINIGFTLSGSNLIFNGTGTNTITNTGFWLSNNTTFNTSGTINFVGIFYYRTGTLTYIAGNINAIGSTLYTSLGTVTFNTDGITWDNVTFIASSTSSVVTLTSNFTCIGTTIIQVTSAPVTVSFVTGTNTFNPKGTLNISFDAIAFQNATITIPNEITVKNCNLTNNQSTSSLTVNSQKIRVLGGTFTPAGVGIILGTTEIVLDSNSIWLQGSAITFRNNITFDGRDSSITIAGTVASYNTGTIRYTSGTVIAKNITLNLTGATTLINCHKIVFSTVTITAGVTITMNQFFSGSPSIKTLVQSSTTANYTIAFQDGFEKVAKFVNVNNATFTRPNQLIILTRMPMKTTNVGGIRYINQSPNGLAKNNAFVTDPMTYPVMGVVQDPNFII